MDAEGLRLALGETDGLTDDDPALVMSEIMATCRQAKSVVPMPPLGRLVPVAAPVAFRASAIAAEPSEPRRLVAYPVMAVGLEPSKFPYP